MSEEMISRRKLITMGSAAAGSVLGLSLVPAEAQAASRARARRSAATWENLVEKSSFSSTTAFNQEWNYNYPWGNMHNGAAKMLPGQVSLSGGVLTLTATRLSQSTEKSPSAPQAPIWWNSGTVHAKEQIIVNDQFPEYDIEGEFRTQTGQGIWPAFWTTGIAPNWPPESDILEYVGDSTNLFNTWTKEAGENDPAERYELSGHNPDTWHKYRVWMTKDGNDVLLDYYFDGVWKASHRGVGWAGIPQYLIMNLQMGSWASGIEKTDPRWAQQPGPSGNTYFRARNVWFGRTRNW
ncbi:family 16 glycosylhydrolase [Nonomuraea sp. NPDC050691]|uniref:glycoside hydrolase family 16 protein n=1 Tax=Nonomuraea sp. NPDC050691 TaxID=3155661 RepID=UPI0033EE9FDB